jgi:Zn-dependent protease with chaperone function
MSLRDGLKALQQQHYSQAVELLEAYCQGASQSSQEYAQAQMALIRAYHGKGQLEKTIALSQLLEQHLDSQVSNWAKKFLSALAKEETPTQTTAETPVRLKKAGRLAQSGMQLSMRGVTDNLTITAIATVGLCVGMVLLVCLALMLVVNRENPLGNLISAIVITIIFGTTTFFISPWILDRIQEWFYKTRWVTLADIERYSPESVEVIKRVCQKKNLSLPRLSIIDDSYPTAFSYGAFQDKARIAVTQGLLTSLDDDEIATVYAHELGHVVHWDFAVMTVASMPMQVAYAIYVQLLEAGRGNDKIKIAIRAVAAVVYGFYFVGTYLSLYLSRIREYYADCFAAQTTGNPNGLSRALVKIADEILKEEKRAKELSKIAEGTRTLTIYDPKTAVLTGTAYPLESAFVWDLFNPWSWWVEMNSTHPLTGKRLCVLASYAEQMRLDGEFDLAIIASKKPSKNKLYKHLIRDTLFYNAQTVGAIAGFILGLTIAIASNNAAILPSFTFFGVGIGIFVNTIVTYPNFQRVSPTDVVTLAIDPYASPLRGRPVQLQGELFGHAEIGSQFSANLKLQDSTGAIAIRYVSRLGALGYFLFGDPKLQKLVGSQVKIVGWFRRGTIPWVDVAYIKGSRVSLKCYPRFLLFIAATGAIAFGFVVPMLFHAGLFKD